jgi:hypothetical protein
MRLVAASAALLLFASCSTQPVRLYELREAEVGSHDREAYDRLEEGVGLVNDFLDETELAVGYPAANTRFELGMTDVRVHVPEQGIYPYRIRTAGWGDLRTLFGDSLHASDQGFLAGHDRRVAEGDAADNVFFRLDADEMGAVLLRQALITREMHARGDTNYWMNYTLCGLDLTVGWGRSSFVDRAANAVEAAYWQWIKNRP